MSEKMVTRPVLVRPVKGLWRREALPGDDVSSSQMVTRELKDGRKVDEWTFNEIEGYIIDIFHNSYEFKELVHFVNIDLHIGDGEMRRVKIALFDRVAQNIMDRIENVKLDRPMAIKIGYSDEKSFSWIVQDGEKVAKRYTKDEPGDKPKWNKIDLPGGKTHWDQTEQLHFWQRKIKEISTQLLVIASNPDNL